MAPPGRAGPDAGGDRGAVLVVRQGDRVVLDVRVVPRASRTEIAGRQGNQLRIRIAAPPVDGAANDELVTFLAKRLGVPKSAVRIMSGHASRSKRVEIIGAPPDALDRL